MHSEVMKHLEILPQYRLYISRYRAGNLTAS